MPTELHTVPVSEDWLAILSCLKDHGAEFVVADATAEAIVAGAVDADGGLVVAPAPYRRNLERVAAALRTLAPRVRSTSEHLHAFDPEQVVAHPALHWPLQVGGTPLDVIGSAVGDGEFSIRVWRTKPVELTAGSRSVRVEVEMTSTPVAV